MLACKGTTEYGPQLENETEYLEHIALHIS